MTVYRFVLPDIRCVRCESVIEQALEAYRLSEKPLFHILSYAIDVSSREVTVEVAEGDSQSKRIQSALKKLFKDHGFNSSASPERSHWVQGGIGVVSGAVLVALSLAHVVFSFPVLVGIASLSTALTLMLGAKSYQKAFANRTQTMDSLFSVSTLAILITSVAALFFPGLPMMFEAGLFIFGFQHLGEGIKQSLKRSIDGEGQFQDRVASRVTVMDSENNRTQKLLVEIQPGETVLIHPGEVVPLDGVCQSESCRMVETIVTGSPKPRTFKLGKEILAGMQVAKDSIPLVLSVTAAAGDSYLARLDQQIYNVKKNNSEKASLQTTANKILDYFIPAVFLIAAGAAVIVGYFFPLEVAFKCAIAVLVSACPCTFGAIPPFALKIGMKKAAEHGVQFKSAKALEKAEQADTVVFDLNGTLTLGIPEVVSYQLVEESSWNHVESSAAFLGTLAAMEETSQHPFAKAIRNYVRTKKDITIHPLEVSSIDMSHHSGIHAEISGDQYILGNESLMTKYGVSVSKAAHEHKTHEESVVYLAKNGQVIGSVLLTDPVREHAKYTIDSLKKMGKTVYLCTGSDEATAHRYAEILGITPHNVRADFRGSKDPSKNRKMAFIQELQQAHRKVAMVGDAGNDALAVAASDFGIAIESKHGDVVTRTRAGAVIQNGSLLPVLNVFQAAQETVHHIKQSLLFSLGYNLVSLSVVGGGGLLLGMAFPPGLCAVVMILQSLLVISNAYRIQKQPLHVMPSEAAVMCQTNAPSCCSSYRRIIESTPTTSHELKSLPIKEPVQPEVSPPSFDVSAMAVSGFGCSL